MCSTYLQLGCRSKRRHDFHSSLLALAAALLQQPDQTRHQARFGYVALHRKFQGKLFTSYAMHTVPMPSLDSQFLFLALSLLAK